MAAPVSRTKPMPPPRDARFAANSGPADDQAGCGIDANPPRDVRFAVRELFTAYHKLQDVAALFELALEPLVRPGPSAGEVLAGHGLAVDRAPLASTLLEAAIGLGEVEGRLRNLLGAVEL